MSETFQKGAKALVPSLEIQSWTTDNEILSKLIKTGGFNAAYAEILIAVSQIESGPIKDVWVESTLDGDESSECARLALVMASLAYALSKKAAARARMEPEAGAEEETEDSDDEIEF